MLSIVLHLALVNYLQMKNINGLEYLVKIKYALCVLFLCKLFADDLKIYYAFNQRI